MRVRTLAIKEFRNLANAKIDLPEDGIVLVGGNGAGKTNFLEALYYIQLLRSFRGARDSDATRFGSSGFRLEALVEGGPVSGNVEVAVTFDRETKRKRATLNDAAPERLSDAFGAAPTTMCSPGDAELIAGPPSGRRRFLDVMLAAVSRPYLRSLQQYRTALAQRNAALRYPARGSDLGAVAVWEPALAEHGAVLTQERREWVATHASDFARFCAAIGEPAEVAISYSSRISPDVQPREALLQALETGRASDARRGATNAGPHRDDLHLVIGTRPMSEFASAGQQRTAALALRMLEARTFRAAFDSYPVLLLDDPFAELDRNRAAGILGLLRDIAPGQSFLCVPRADEIPAQLSRLERWEIDGGVVSSPHASPAAR